MVTATLPLTWRGRSGRTYVPVDGARLRHGGMASVRKVTGRDGPVGTSVVEDGAPLALKLWHEGDEPSLDQLQQEARILVEISAAGGELPCPRLYDLVGDPLVTGVVMEWCPVDLERWWRDKLGEPDAFGRLMAAMTEVCKRTAEYHDFFQERRGTPLPHGDLKPSNVLLSMGGRWLVSDFGTARVNPPEDAAWAASQILVATENFMAPEVMFNARIRHPAALDTWSLGATVFALLKLKRMVESGATIPKNGTHSPRFRMERMNRVIEIFGRDPRRFVERDLVADDFVEPLRLPEEDRREVREAMRGVFGRGQDAREDELVEALLDVLDRALSVDPAHRFTDARDLSAAFDQLTRLYIGLAAAGPGGRGAALDLDVESLRQGRDEAVARQRLLEEQVLALQDRLRDLRNKHTTTPAPVVAMRAREVPPAPVSAGASTPAWWGVVWVAQLALQALTLALLVATLAWVALG